MRAPTRREQVFALVFALSLAWGMWNYRHLLTGRDSVAQNTFQPVAAATTTEEPTTDGATRSAQSNLAQASWGGDPFNRPWRSARTEPARHGVGVRKEALKLSSIVVRPDERYAIINGTRVRVGDRVAGWRVTRIESSKVLLDDQGVEVTLTL